MVKGLWTKLANLVLYSCLLSSRLFITGLLMRSQVLFCIKNLAAIPALDLLGSIMGFCMLGQPRLRWKHPLTYITNYFGTLDMNFLMGFIGGIIPKILLTLLAVIRCGIHVFGPYVTFQSLG